MELFTVGIGPYTQADVRDAARALTGWTVEDGQFRVNAQQHDDGEKVVLSRRGRLTGDDLVALLAEHPATSQRLATRLCDHFLGAGVVSTQQRDVLAAGLRAHNLDIGWATATILRSQLFFAESSMGRMVASPIDFVVGAVRSLELFDPAPSTVVLADWAARLGQQLFYPPNVFGWPGGRAWLTPRSAMLRASFAFTLVEALDARALARRHGCDRDLARLHGFFLELLLGRVLTPAWRDRLLAGASRERALEPDAIRRAVATILASPEAQVV